MPAPEFFRQFGLFILPDFLSPEWGRTLLDSIACSPVEKVTVTRTSGEVYLDETSRKSEYSVIPLEVLNPLKERFAGLIPDLEAHFKVPLTGVESPQCLIYHPGHFFKPHQDGAAEGADQKVRRRRVSVVVFLNRQSPEPAEGAYGEGFLRFHGLLDGPQWEAYPLPMKAVPGLLVAFSADKVHEVTPVAHGRRYTLVTWYYGPDTSLPE